MLIVSSVISLDNSLGSSIVLLSYGVAAIICVAGVILSRKIHKGDELKRTTPLFYELDDDVQNKFTVVQQACEALSRSARIWRIQTEQPTWDRRRNAGASSLITRHSAFVTQQSPPYIATNVDVWSIKLNDFTLFFMPDYVFVLQQGKYGAVSYSALKVSFSAIRFIEDQGVPPDSQVLDYTWRFVNKNGSPDRRFSNNAQIPVVQYGFVLLQSNTGMNVHLNVSQVGAAKYFVDALNHVLGYSQQYRERYNDSSGHQHNEPAKPSPDSTIRSAYDVLGVPFNATGEQITAAYYQMAKMYHPDRLAHLAPEFTELAEERMKEINVAYETLKKR